MKGARVYPWIVLAAAVGGCGSEAERPTLAAPAEARTIELGWVERSTRPAFVYRVERLVARAGGWTVEAEVENRSRADYQIVRPHYARGSKFGLVLLKTKSTDELNELTADLRREPPFLPPDRIEPPLPTSLRAGETWRGTLSGSTVLRQGAVVRVIFGRFRGDTQPAVFTWVTEHAVRL
jgi:hypothetical protein